MDGQDVRKAYSRSLIAGCGFLSMAKALFKMSADRPGFAEDFDDLVENIILDAKNFDFAGQIPADEEADAVREAIDNLDEIFAKWRRQIGDTKKTT
jgi:hypothetical protein